MVGLYTNVNYVSRSLLLPAVCADIRCVNIHRLWVIFEEFCTYICFYGNLRFCDILIVLRKSLLIPSLQNIIRSNGDVHLEFEMSDSTMHTGYVKSLFHELEAFFTPSVKIFSTNSKCNFSFL